MIIHQELALSPFLSIAENIFLGNEQSKGGFIDWNKTNLDGRRAAAARRPEGQPGHQDRRHRCRQAAARRDREGALEGGEAPHPRRAHRRAERRRLRAPARAHPLAAGRGHDGDHHQPQAQRDQGDRGQGHDHPRRQDHRDARHAGRRRVRGPDHPRDGRPRPVEPVPRAREPRHRRGTAADRGLDRPPPARLVARDHPPGQPQRPRRRGRRHRRAHGRRPHRARDERLRPVLRHRHQRHRLQARHPDQDAHRLAGDRQRHRLRHRGPQALRPEPDRRHQAEHLRLGTRQARQLGLRERLARRPRSRRSSSRASTSRRRTSTS